MAGSYPISEPQRRSDFLALEQLGVRVSEPLCGGTPRQGAKRGRVPVPRIREGLIFGTMLRGRGHRSLSWYRRNLGCIPASRQAADDTHSTDQFGLGELTMPEGLRSQ